MTDPLRQQAADSVPTHTAEEAALIATFYGLRGGTSIRRLHDRLYEGLGSASEYETADRWENPAEGTIGRRFNPPGGAAHDATAVQLALNAPGEASIAWRDMQARLDRVLGDDGLDGLWGYTLVYQAVLAEGADPEAALGEMLPAFQGLHRTDDLQPLARADVPGGRLWLIDVPILEDRTRAASVYVVLGPPEGEDALLDMFYGPAATLLAPDLIAHKGYYQMRQYHGGDLESRVVEKVEHLRSTTDQLLADLERRDVKDKELDALFRVHLQLLPLLAGLKNLHSGLLQQLENYKRWQAHARDNDVIRFHRDQLKMATLELQLKLEPIQHALDTADKGISVAQVQVDKRQEDLQRRNEKAQQIRQRRLETFLAVLASALALPELINQDAARAILDGAGLSIRGNTTPDVLTLLAAQIAIIAGAAILLGLAVNVFNRWRQN